MFNIKFLSLVFYLGATALLTYVIMEATQLHPLIAWVGAINIVEFILMAKDKASAKAHLPRTPERTMFVLALLGGFPGLFAGRHLFNHKTSKKSFMVTMWLLFAVQMGVVAWLVKDIPLEKLGLKRKNPALTVENSAEIQPLQQQ